MRQRIRVSPIPLAPAVSRGARLCTTRRWLLLLRVLRTLRIRPKQSASPSPRRKGEGILQPLVSPSPLCYVRSVYLKTLMPSLCAARFRIKKKQRTTNLERSVSDLTGRAEDLEREAADLRRENGWLKEIVMLKGSRLAGVNLASRMAENTQRSSEGSSQAGPSRQKPSEPSSEDESSDEEVAKAKKKKGKSRKK